MNNKIEKSRLKLSFLNKYKIENTNCNKVKIIKNIKKVEDNRFMKVLLNERL